MRRVEGTDFVYNNCMIILNCSVGVSVSDEVGAGSLALSGAEAIDGEEGEEQSSIEGLTGEQKNDDHSQVSGKEIDCMVSMEIRHCLGGFYVI